MTEVMLAGAIMTLLTLVTFEGIIFSTRIAHRNADLLAAEAVAWDAVWKKFNEDFDKMSTGTTTEILSESAAPQLTIYNQAPTLKMKITIPTSNTALRCIEADVEWGPSNARRKLSDTQRTMVYRGELSRVVSWQ